MLNTYDTFSPNHPANQIEVQLAELTELEEAQEYNWELKNKLKRVQVLVNRYFEIVDNCATFENTTSDELVEKLKIKQQLLKLAS